VIWSQIASENEIENEIESVISRSASADALFALASFPYPHRVASSAATSNGSAVVENWRWPLWIAIDSWMLVWTFVLLLHCADGRLVHYFSSEYHAELCHCATGSLISTFCLPSSWFWFCADLVTGSRALDDDTAAAAAAAAAVNRYLQPTQFCCLMLYRCT
jgi:hypothetical protein